MNQIELFSSVLAQRGRVRSGAYSTSPAYDHLIKAGLIEEAGIVSSVICDECEYPHDAKIIHEGSQYGYYCPDLGFLSQSRADLIAVEPNLCAFIGQIADALTCKRRKSSPIGKETWRIGAVDSPAGDVALYLHPTLQDAQDMRDFQAALAGEVKSTFGVILTSQGTLTAPPFVTIQLEDVLSFEPMAGKLIVTADLRTVAGVPEQRTGGRPNDYRKLLSDLFTLRANEGRILRGRNEEAKALQAEFQVRFPDIKCPSLSTVKKYVSEMRRG